MRLTPIIDGHLWAVESVLSNLVAHTIDAVDWTAQEHTRLDIGAGHRRNIVRNDLRDAVIDQHVQAQVVPRIEQQCQVRFVNPVPCNYQIWLDEPGFRPRMHTDGRKPSALQVYWHPKLDPGLGSVFYSTASLESVVHYFASEPNTGYFMLNDHAPYPDLWHDMLTPVPAGTLRLSLYFSFGPYVKLS
jgi:hypothetical protein